jgi:predicted dehydrogenase
VIKFLVVGLGSMGKRRVRNLSALGHREIAGFDVRADRRAESAALGLATVFDSLDQAFERFRPDAVVVSTSPEAHMDVVFEALARGLPCFIEASVVDAPRIRELAQRADARGVLMAPSCTMRYFPGPRIVRELLEQRAIGRVLSFSYQTGQYLPDWHPWERIEDFYVSRRETGGAREIVPFELTWLAALFGPPEPLACAKAKRSDMPADIDDLYHCLLAFPDGLLGSLSVDVLARPTATRELRILGSEGQLVMSADEQCVRYCSLATGSQWVRRPIVAGSVQDGYINPEEPYIAEMSDFVRAVEQRQPALFPNNLRDDARLLDCLERLEALSSAALAP